MSLKFNTITQNFHVRIISQYTTWLSEIKVQCHRGMLATALPTNVLSMTIYLSTISENYLTCSTALNQKTPTGVGPASSRFFSSSPSSTSSWASSCSCILSTIYRFVSIALEGAGINRLVTFGAISSQPGKISTLRTDLLIHSSEWALSIRWSWKPWQRWTRIERINKQVIIQYHKTKVINKHHWTNLLKKLFFTLFSFYILWYDSEIVGRCFI